MIELPSIIPWILLGIVMIYGTIVGIKYSWFYNQNNPIIFVTGFISLIVTIIVTIVLSITFFITQVRWV